MTIDISKIPIPNPAAIAGVDDAGIARRLISDLAHSLSLFEGEDEAAQLAKLNAAIAMVRDLVPGDTLEAQLIVQIVSAQNIAAAAMRRANSPGASCEAQAAALKIAARFMSLFREQTRTLTDYRGTPDDVKRKFKRYGYERENWPENRHKQQDEDEDEDKAGTLTVSVDMTGCPPENEEKIRALVTAAVAGALGRHHPSPQTNGHAQNGYAQNGYAQNGYAQNGYAQNGYAQNGHAPTARPPRYGMTICGAKTRRGDACRALPVRGTKRCRMHGGKGSGAPAGNRNALKNGLFTAAERALRRELRRIENGMREDLKAFEKPGAFSIRTALRLFLSLMGEGKFFLTP